MLTGQGFILVYSITSRASFKELSIIRERITRLRDEIYFPMVVAANKCDLETARTVTTTEGQELAKSIDCPFFETSAQDKINVEESFYQLVREIRKRDPAPNGEVDIKKGKKSCSIL